MRSAVGKEEKEGGREIRSNTVFCRYGLRSIYIAFYEGDFSGGGMFCGQCFEDGGDDFAGAAPSCVDLGVLVRERRRWEEGGGEGVKVQSITTTEFLLASPES